MTLRLNKIRVLNIYEGYHLSTNTCSRHFTFLVGFFHYREVFFWLNNHKNESYFSGSLGQTAKSFLVCKVDRYI